MGAYLPEPNKNKYTKQGKLDNLSFCACEMQGKI